ncbi:MAG: DUF1501 domain-containing protein [Nitrospiraceae bacterium]
MLSRRDILKLIGALPLVILASPVPTKLWAAPVPKATVAKGRWDRILVLVELYGGNDGLNTVIPYSDDRYYQLRPRLAIPRDRVLQLTSQLGFHSALEPLMPLWEAKELAVVQGVGYDRPNRSHFRSIEIWETGSESEQVLDEGWLARLFTQSPLPEDFTAEGILLGKGDAGPLSGGKARTIALHEPEQFIHQADRVALTEVATKNRALAHILHVQQEILHAAGDLQSRLQHPPTLSASFPATRIGKELEVAAKLLAARVPIAVIKVAHGSFDTHAGQLNQHQRLLEELAQALNTFRTAMRQQGLWDRVLVMTYSEFGRRVAENGSNGTDHGTAAPHLLIGGRVRGGLYGGTPSLSDLQDGDLRHTMDYRSLYATVIHRWWGLPVGVFGNSDFSTLDCFG